MKALIGLGVASSLGFGFCLFASILISSDEGLAARPFLIMSYTLLAVAVLSFSAAFVTKALGRDRPQSMGQPEDVELAHQSPLNRALTTLSLVAGGLMTFLGLFAVSPGGYFVVAGLGLIAVVLARKTLLQRNRRS